MNSSLPPVRNVGSRTGDVNEPRHREMFKGGLRTGHYRELKLAKAQVHVSRHIEELVSELEALRKKRTVLIKRKVQ